MKSVLLVFDDQKELEFIEANLIENGFQIFICDNLKSAVVLAENTQPDLIVVNTLDSGIAVQLFCSNIKSARLNNVSFLALIESADSFNKSSTEHFIVKPIRPKLLLSLIREAMNQKDLSWYPACISF